MNDFLAAPDERNRQGANDAKETRGSDLGDLGVVAVAHGRLARNAVWNWAGMATHLLTGFVVAPFLVHHLGQTGYGLWILIASLTGYFAVLDLGVSGSVGRNVAFLRAKNDRDGVNRLVSTALAILSGVAALCVIATLGAVALFFLLFDVAADQVDAARIALLLVGLNLAMSFVFGVF